MSRGGGVGLNGDEGEERVVWAVWKVIDVIIGRS